MPIYNYKNEAGDVIERNVPIDERDNQSGLERILTFTGSVYAGTAGGMR